MRQKERDEAERGVGRGSRCEYAPMILNPDWPRVSENRGPIQGGAPGFFDALRDFEAQKQESTIGCNVLNRMAEPGMPESYPVIG